MKIKLNIPQFGTILALLLIAYQNISAMIWQYSVESTTLFSLLMLIVAFIAVYVLFSKSIQRRSVEGTLLEYYLYIISVCLINGYMQIYIQEPTMLVTSVYWMFIFILFKESAKRKNLSAEAFSQSFLILTIICFILFCRYYFTNKSAKYSLTGLNIIYYLLFMLPALLISKDKKIVTVGVVLNLIAVLLSSKRGALIAVVAALLVWKQFDLNNKKAHRINTEKLLRMLLFGVLGIAVVYGALVIVEKMNLDIFQRMETFLTGEDNDGSGRTKIWHAYWRYMKEDSFWNNLIGRGYSATKRNPDLKMLGMSWAHNDFLQILFDYGIIGLAIFCSIILKLFMIARKMKRAQYCYYAPFLASLIIFVICCCVSMVTLLPQWFLTMAAFWGVVIGNFELERTGG